MTGCNEFVESLLSNSLKHLSNSSKTTMVLLYTHLSGSKDQPNNFPRKNSDSSEQNKIKPNQNALARKNQKKFVEHLRKVQENYSLEQRLFL